MTTLADFLLARIAEDEAVARAAVRGPWRTSDDDGLAHEHDDVEPYLLAHVSWEQAPHTAPTFAHIARHDPARVLAECEAKRRIVDKCDRDAEDDLGLDVLELLALPYADHEDFQDEWRP